MSIILYTEKNGLLFEFLMSFDLAGVTLEPFRVIMKMKESHKLNQNHLCDGLTLSFLLYDNEDFNNA